MKSTNPQKLILTQQNLHQPTPGFVSCRERRRAGILAVVSVEVHKRDVDVLVARHLLTAEDGTDREKLASAVRRALDAWRLS